MSEPLQDMERDWRLYVDDMISFAEKVLLYTDGLGQEKFVASGLNYDATVRNLELIGEAATRFLLLCARRQRISRGVKSSLPATG